VETVPAVPLVEDISAAELLEAFQGAVTRRRISAFYQLGLLLVTVFMLFLPVAYLALTAALAWGVYWYAVYGLALFTSLAGGLYGIIIRAALYVAPNIAGIVAVFFMFKPLLAKNPKRVEPLELNPSNHPRVYQFIAHISDVLRVPMPSRIEVTAELNASAGFRKGFLSFLGRDLVLSIGLPMVAGLNTRQLAAVIAHELGHCTQGLAMRLYYIIAKINLWFERVIYQRDTWDESLEEWAAEVESGLGTFIVWCAQMAVAMSRGLLRLLMFLGDAAMCFLSREMEYHADSCAIGVAGSAAVEGLQLRFRELKILDVYAYQGLTHFWKQRRQLPESLTEFLDQLEQRAPADFREKTAETLLNESAGFFATHPTPAQRIRKARQLGEPGVFTLERPARLLFRNFEGVSKIVTLQHFRRFLRLAVMPAMLKPAKEFFKEPPPANDDAAGSS